MWYQSIKYYHRNGPFIAVLQFTLVISIPLTVPTYKKVLFKHKFTPLGTHASTENLKKKKLG